MLGVYFSGTGNTAHCVWALTKALDPGAPVLRLESERTLEELREADTVILGYPTQFSNMPYMVRDFIRSHADLWPGKRIFLVVTMGVFSGDGAGCGARLLKKYGAVILGGLHVKMPDSVCDSSLMKRTEEGNAKLVAAADKKLAATARGIQEGRYPQNGLSFFAHCLGFLGQRMWFLYKTTRYNRKLYISDACIGCGNCARICPMKNLTIQGGKAVAGKRCTMCYRCIAYCQAKAITMLGGEGVLTQWKMGY